MKVSDIFDVKYGVNLELNKCEISEDDDAINFVSRVSTNNGVVAKVKKIEGVEPQKAGTISCAASGFGVLCSFIQTSPYYSGRDLYILTPKKEMSFNEKLFYCMCLRANAYKYAWNRQANRTLKNIELPDDIPDYVKKVEVEPIKSNIEKSMLDLNIENWKEVKIGEIFDIKNGIKYPAEYRESGDMPIVTTSSVNNGITDYIKERDDGSYSNFLTVAYSGSVGVTFYHERKVFVGETVFALIPKVEFNKYIGLFLACILTFFNKKYDYGRKIIGSKYLDESIKLPVTPDGVIDWMYIEKYTKSLPYSDKI